MEALRPSGGDLVIPIIDLDLYHPNHTRSQSLWNGSPSLRTTREYNFQWNEYTWNGFSMGVSQHGIKETFAASPGFGWAANSVLGIYNVEEKIPRFDGDILSEQLAARANNNNMPLYRSKDPGVGAFKPYHNRGSIAKYSIQSGLELFVSYGDNWFVISRFVSFFFRDNAWIAYAYYHLYIIIAMFLG